MDGRASIDFRDTAQQLCKRDRRASRTTRDTWKVLSLLPFTQKQPGNQVHEHLHK